MHRRDLLRFLALSAVSPAWSRAAETGAVRNLKIAKVDVLVTNPGQTPLGNYVLVKIATNQPGLYGWGDATC